MRKPTRRDSYRNTLKKGTNPWEVFCVDCLIDQDPDVARIIANETARVENTIDLIAAENHTPRAIMEARGSIFATKAAEGYPGHRFHAGCKYSDEIENLAISRGKALFSAGHVNVQPHSGTSANLAVYFSVLKPGDRILSMKLSHGGHLSHGNPASITARCFRFEHYGVVRDTGCIDYDEVHYLAETFRPKMIVAGASSYARLIDYQKMAEIAGKVSAYMMVDMAHIAGLVAAGVIPSPIPHSDFVTFTTYKTLMGGRGGVILCRKKYADTIDKAIFPGSQGTPSLNSIAAKAVCFKAAMTKAFVKMQERTLENASFFANEFQKRGYQIVSGGTDNHLLLLDLRSKRMLGNAAEGILESVNILVNRNLIPYDSEKPTVAGGIRIGTPAVTARGMGKAEIIQMTRFIDRVLVHGDDQNVLHQTGKDVLELCRRFPVYISDGCSGVSYRGYAELFGG